MRLYTLAKVNGLWNVLDADNETVLYYTYLDDALDYVKTLETEENKNAPQHNLPPKEQI